MMMLRSLRLKSLSSLSSLSLSSLSLRSNIKDFQDKKVLVVGDGDLSFSLSLCEHGRCQQVLATTWDNSTRLFKSFNNSKDNVENIIKNGGLVDYGIDATKLPQYYDKNSFDIVVWNFPHVPGKANIRRNRLLLNNFFISAKDVIHDDGKIMVSLVGGQSGTNASNTEEWNYSFKLIQQVAEAGLHLVSCKPFSSSDYVGYKPLGHRGHGGSFLIDGSEVFCIQKTLKNSAALQAPLYIHEVHVLASGIALDVNLFQAKARYLVKQLCSNIAMSQALWTVNLVDIYICPKTKKISHVFQISYCSLTQSLSRKNADDIRSYIENNLPAKLELEPRKEKHGHSVSQSYGWHIAKALQQLQQIDDDKGIMDSVNETTLIKFDKDDGISVALRDMDNLNYQQIDKDLDDIQKTARALWWKRASILVALPRSIDLQDIKNISYQTKDIYNNDNIKQSIEAARYRSDKINSLSTN